MKILDIRKIIKSENAITKTIYQIVNNLYNQNIRIYIKYNQPGVVTKLVEHHQ